MVNFRFHIVSITAVFLALGIGLVLGTTFLDDATIDGLKAQLDGLEGDLDRAQARNDQQQAELDALHDESAQLASQLGERLYAGLLAGDPVLVVSTRGVDQALVDGVLAALVQADADVLGTWWLTDRLLLEDGSDVEDLSSALPLDTDDADRLGRSLAVQLADVLHGTSDAGAPGPAPIPPGAPGAVEPALLARLRQAGFVEYQLPDGVDGDVVRLPPSGTRIVIVDGPGAAVPPGKVVVPVLRELTADGPVPVVATSSTPRQQGDEGDPPALVSLVRQDGTLQQRLSGVDHADRTAGRVATVLATVDARPGSPTLGQYGVGDGADRLLPPGPGGRR